MPDPESPAVVSTDGGPVTLVDLVGLRARMSALENQAASLTARGMRMAGLKSGGLVRFRTGAFEIRKEGVS